MSNVFRVDGLTLRNQGRNQGRTFVRMSSLLCVMLAAACSSQTDSTGEGSDEIQLEQQPIPTSLKELRAGQPYIPGIDESSVLATNPCLSNAKVIVRGGLVTSSAAIVATRASLNVELGLEASGTIPVVGGLSGAASLSAKTTFDSRTAAALFQTVGTYESTVNTDAVPAPFEMGSVSKCGFGYVARAQHRVAAALIVNMRSTGANIDARASASVGKENVASVKGSLSTIIQKGNVEITLRFAADVIPEVPPPPFGEAAVLAVGDGDSEKQTAINKIESALTWLANANSAVQKYILALQASTDPAAAPPPAPTEKVSFRYYPSTPPEVRGALELTAKNAMATRKGLAETASSIATWESYVTAAKEGHGHEWNIAAAPADSVAALRSKAAEILDTSGGKLRNYENDLSSALETCVLALRNEKNEADAAVVIAALKTGCTAPAASPVDKAKSNIRPIAVVSTAENNGGVKCATGTRLPNQKETSIFKAWSAAKKADESGGLWTEDGASCTFTGFPWLNDGKLECSGFLPHKGLSVCVSKATGPFPEE